MYPFLLHTSTKTRHNKPKEEEQKNATYIGEAKAIVSQFCKKSNRDRSRDEKHIYNDEGGTHPIDFIKMEN